MSYCRWSSDDFGSDVYVYEDVYGGWTTHVAGNRVVPMREYPPDVEVDPKDEASIDAWVARYREVMNIIHDSPREPIGLPHDGETFNDETPGECADRLAMLRDAGYHVPEGVIEALRAEQEEQ